MPSRRKGHIFTRGAFWVDGVVYVEYLFQSLFMGIPLKSTYEKVRKEKEQEVGVSTRVGNLTAWAGFCQAQDQAHIILNKSRSS